jgi:acyl-CoA thioester hydrolase
MRKLILEPGWDESHEWKICVYYEDTDAGGVVYYANYLKFMERARTEWLRSLGVSQHEMALQQARGFIVADLSMKYRAPAQLDDALTIQTTITQARQASLHFAQRVLRNQDVLAEGRIRVGCVEVGSFRPAPLPESLYQQIIQLQQRQ